MSFFFVRTRSYCSHVDIYPLDFWLAHFLALTQEIPAPTLQGLTRLLIEHHGTHCLWSKITALHVHIIALAHAAWGYVYNYTVIDASGIVTHSRLSKAHNGLYKIGTRVYTFAWEIAFFWLASAQTHRNGISLKTMRELYYVLCKDEWGRHAESLEQPERPFLHYIHGEGQGNQHHVQ